MKHQEGGSWILGKLKTRKFKCISLSAFIFSTLAIDPAMAWGGKRDSADKEIAAVKKEGVQLAQSASRIAGHPTPLKGILKISKRSGKACPRVKHARFSDPLEIGGIGEERPLPLEDFVDSSVSLISPSPPSVKDHTLPPLKKQRSEGIFVEQIVPETHEEDSLIEDQDSLRVLREIEDYLEAVKVQHGSFLTQTRSHTIPSATETLQADRRDPPRKSVGEDSQKPCKEITEIPALPVIKLSWWKKMCICCSSQV